MFLILEELFFQLSDLLLLIHALRLSTSGLARDALTGVTKSTQYDDSLVVKTGIIIIFIDLLMVLAYVFIILYIS